MSSCGIEPSGRVYLKLDAPKDDGAHIGFHPQGRNTYLWIGGDSGCYGHVGGAESLRKFARELLKAIPAKKRKAKR